MNANLSSTVRSVGIRVLLADLAIFFVIGLLGWFLDWRTPSQFGSGLFWAGLLVIGFGTISMLGTWDSTRNFPYMYSQTVSSRTLERRIAQNMADEMQCAGFLCQLILTALAPLLAGILLTS